MGGIGIFVGAFGTLIGAAGGFLLVPILLVAAYLLVRPQTKYSAGAVIGAQFGARPVAKGPGGLDYQAAGNRACPSSSSLVDCSVLVSHQIETNILSSVATDRG